MSNPGKYLDVDCVRTYLEAVCGAPEHHSNLTWTIFVGMAAIALIGVALAVIECVWSAETLFRTALALIIVGSAGVIGSAIWGFVSDAAFNQHQTAAYASSKADYDRHYEAKLTKWAAVTYGIKLADGDADALADSRTVAVDVEGEAATVTIVTAGDNIVLSRDGGPLIKPIN
jgi:hypothetical protein